MEHAVQMASMAAIAAILCLTIRQHEKVLAMVLSLLAGLMILLSAGSLLAPIWSVLQQLRSLSGLADPITNVLCKVACIGLLTQFSVSICQEAEETALSKVAEMTGAVFSLYTALPLLSSILGLLEQMLGGS